MKKLVIISVAFIAALGLAASAKAGPTSVSVDPSSNLVFGGSAIIDYSTSDPDPWLHLSCSQSGSVVQETWLRVTTQGNVFPLGSTELWTSGAADCTVDLQQLTHNGTMKNVRSVSFHVNA